MVRQRRSFENDFKRQIVESIVSGSATQAELAREHRISKVTPIVKTKYRLSYSYTFILETMRSLLKYTSAGGEYPRAE